MMDEILTSNTSHEKVPSCLHGYYESAEQYSKEKVWCVCVYACVGLKLVVQMIQALKSLSFPIARIKGALPTCPPF